MKAGRAEGAAFWSLVVLVCASAIPFGSNRPWAWLLLPVLVLPLFVWRQHLDRRLREDAARDLKRLGLPLLLTLGTLLWVLIQTSTLVPPSWQHPAYSLVGVEGTISLQPERTAQFGLRLLAYVMIFWMAVRFGSEAALARRGFMALAVFSSLMALYALTLALLGSQTILWFEKWAMRGHVTGTFVNKNSYATYIGLGLVLNVSLLFVSLQEIAGYRWPSRRAAVRAWLQRLWGDAFPWLAGVLLCGSTLLMTASRGGVLASAFAVLILILALQAPLRVRRAAPLTLAALLPLFAFMIWNASTPVLNRLFTQDLSEGARQEVYARLLLAIEDVGLFGTGLGTFQEAFRPYKTAELGRFTWDLAHNSYLENALELGWLAAASLVLALGIICWRLLRGLRERRRRHYFAASGLAASALVGLHAGVDFSLQMPAIASAYALILGLAFAQSWPSSQNRDP